jgi:subtilisin family serine protease
MATLGITGKGVTVAILDDGLDYKSKDLKDNFVSYPIKRERVRDSSQTNRNIVCRGFS